MSIDSARHEMKAAIRSDVENGRGWFASVTGKIADKLGAVKQSTWEHIGFRLGGPLASVGAAMGIVHSAGLESNASVMAVGVAAFGTAVASYVGGEEKARVTAMREETRGKAALAEVSAGDRNADVGQIVSIGGDGKAEVQFEGTFDEAVKQTGPDVGSPAPSRP